MATQTYTDDVIIDGSENEVQLQVQGHSTQTESLQEWQDSAGTVLARIAEDGRFQNGDTGLTTPDALIEAHRDDNSSLPQRGLNTLGRIASTLTTPISWLVSELVLLGTATISGLHTAMRGRLTHSSSGNSTNAELRAGDFEIINQSGSNSTPVGTAVSVQGTVDNQANAYLTKGSALVAQIQNATGADIETAVALEVATPINDGTIDTLIGVEIPDINQGTDNYAIRTGDGIVHLGDVLELEQLSADPANKANVVQFYAKSDKLYAKAPDPDNTIYDLTQAGSVSASVTTIDATAGEGLTANDAVFINPTDNKVYQLDSDAVSLAVDLIRGFVTNTVALDDTATVQLSGVLAGFSGLNAGQTVFASTSAGDITQTRPIPVHGGGQIAIAGLGVALSATEVMIKPAPVQYQLRDRLSENEQLTLNHHSDEKGFLRRIRAYITEMIVGQTIEDYASSNQDVVVNLRDRAVSSYGSDECSGGTASASSEASATVAAGKAFDDTNSTRWVPSGGATGWLEYDFGTNKTIRRYTVRCIDVVNSAPKNWTFEYFDGSSWVVVDTQTNQTGWLAYQQASYEIDTIASAQKWRINISANNGNAQLAVSEIEMMEAATFDEGADKLAQTFTLATSAEIGIVGLFLKKIGNPTGTLTLRIETTSNGEPTGTLAHASATTSIPESSLATSLEERLISFLSSFTLASGTYAIVLSSDRTASETDYAQWGADDNLPSYSGGEMWSEESASWSVQSKDAIFAVYEPGTEHPGQVAVDSWLSSNADLVNRFGDGSGNDLDISTTFKCLRQAGFDDVTLVVELD